MKVLIASDLHGSALYTEQLLALYDKLGAEKLLLLGDILYHGPRNDLPAGYDTKAVARMLNERKQCILSVRGNCEAEVDQMVLDFPVLTENMFFVADGVTFFVTHGHVFNMQNPPMMQPGDILLHGHTHVPAWEAFGENRYCNPGSVSIPKNGSAHSCILYEDRTLQWMDLGGNIYRSEKL